MVRVLRCLSLAAALAGPGLVQLSGAASGMPFALDSTGGIVIQARINGHGPYRLLVDTGSSRGALSQRVAIEVAAPVVAKTPVVSIGQEAMRLVVKLDRVEAGSAVRADALASVIPDAELKAVASDIDGVLGQNFLAAFDYTIDYRTRTVSWEADAAARRSGDGRFNLRSEEGRFLVEIPGDQTGQRALRLVPDSGASVMVLYQRNGQLPASLGRARRALEVAGLSGGRQAVLSTLTRLRIGPVLLRDAPVVVLSECDDAPGADGLLPLSLFDRVTFLVSKGQVVLSKD